MKKEYILPVINEITIRNCKLLAGSRVSSNSIDYGGVDIVGNKDPSAPLFDALEYE